MAPKKQAPKVSLGVVLDELPEPVGSVSYKGAPHWREAANLVKANPGQWCQIVIDTLSPKALQSAASSINAATRGTESKTGKNKAFVEAGYTARFRKGLGLMVRYDAPADVAHIGKRAG